MNKFLFMSNKQKFKEIKITYKILKVKSKNGALTKEEIIELQNLKKFFEVNKYLEGKKDQVKNTPTKATIDQKINKENNNNLPNTRSSAKNYIVGIKNINKNQRKQGPFINQKEQELFGNFAGNTVNKKLKFD
jgi:hypothetical protein